MALAAKGQLSAKYAQTLAGTSDEAWRPARARILIRSLLHICLVKGNGHEDAR